MLAITLSAPGLAGRFAAAAAFEPLSALPPARRTELEELLRLARDLDELPGWWQAALLAAEAARAGAPPPVAGGCCADQPAPSSSASSPG